MHNPITQTETTETIKNEEPTVETKGFAIWDKGVVEERQDFDEFQTFTQIAKSKGENYAEAFLADNIEEGELATVTSITMDGRFEIRSFVVLNKGSLEFMSFVAPNLTGMGVKEHLEFLSYSFEMHLDGKTKEQSQFFEPALEELE